MLTIDRVYEYFHIKCDLLKKSIQENEKTLNENPQYNDKIFVGENLSSNSIEADIRRENLIIRTLVSIKISEVNGKVVAIVDKDLDYSLIRIIKDFMFEAKNYWNNIDVKSNQAKQSGIFVGENNSTISGNIVLNSQTKSEPDPQLETLAHMQELTSEVIEHLRQEEPEEKKMTADEYHQMLDVEDFQIQRQNQKHIERIHHLKTLIQKTNLELADSNRDEIEKRYLRQDLELFNKELQERSGLIMVNVTKEMLIEAFAEKNQVSPSQIRFVP